MDTAVRLCEVLDRAIRARAQLWLDGSELRVRSTEPEVGAYLLTEFAPFREQLIGLLKGARGSDSCLMPLSADAGGLAIYGVHATQGSLTEYRYLARALYPNASFYGFQQRPGALDVSVSDVARKYCHELLSHRGNRPFALYGASAGGILALEMARVLAMEGAPPDVLFLGDTLDPACTGLTEGGGLGWYGWVSFVDGHCGRLWLGTIGRESPFWTLDEYAKLDYLAERLGGRYTAAWSTREDLARIYSSFLTYSRSFENYSVDPPSIRTVYFRAANSSGGRACAMIEAMHASGCSRIVDLPSEHMDLVRPVGAKTLGNAILLEIKSAS